jgi:hypothetical protein
MEINCAGIESVRVEVIVHPVVENSPVMRFSTAQQKRTALALARTARA